MTSLSADQVDLLRTLINKHQLDSVGELIESAAQNAVHLVTSVPNTPSVIGISRIGGVPDLPPSMAWPKLEDKYLIFVGQINLAEIPRFEDSPLPPSGMLYFFRGYDEPAWDVAHQVLFFDGPTHVLASARQPAIQEFDEAEDLVSYEPCQLLMKQFISIPNYASQLYQLFETTFEEQGVRWQEFATRYLALQNELQGFTVRHSSELSQMLGYPAAIGHDPSYDAQQVREGKYVFSAEEPDTNEVKKWRLLFEVGSHDAAGMLWWDAGFLQFLVHEDDLSKLNFANTYACIASS